MCLAAVVPTLNFPNKGLMKEISVHLSLCIYLCLVQAELSATFSNMIEVSCLLILCFFYSNYLCFVSLDKWRIHHEWFHNWTVFSQSQHQMTNQPPVRSQDLVRLTKSTEASENRNVRLLTLFLFLFILLRASKTLHPPVINAN